VHLGIFASDLPGLAPVNHLQRRRPDRIELVLPSLVDASAAPPGHHTVELMQLLEPASARGWFEQPELTDPLAQRRSAGYAARKAAFAEALIDAAARLIPDSARAHRLAQRGQPGELQALRLERASARCTAAATRTMGRWRGAARCPAWCWPAPPRTGPASRRW
jgi:phytoene dehydrogenase-like protein